MNIKFKYYALIFSVVLLSACGGGGSAPGGGSSLPGINTPATDSTTINDYAVTGSDVVNASGNIPINAGVNGGAFQVTWDVDSSDPYHAELYLSADSTLERNTDIKIFEQNCGSVSLLYNCGQKADFDCRFTSENKMSCHTITTANRERDLTTFLDTIPKSAHLMLYACNALFSNCKTSSVAVELF